MRFVHHYLIPLITFFCLLSAPLFSAEPIRDHDIVPEDYFDLATLGGLEVSPDGAFAAYVEGRWGKGKEGRKSDLWVVNLNTKERRRLTFDGFGASGPVFEPTGKWIYFTGRSKRAGEKKPPHDGSRQVFRIAVSGGEPFPVTRTAKGVGAFLLSADGQAVFFTTAKEVYEEDWKALRKKYADLEYGHGKASLNAIRKLDLVSWREEEVLAAKQVIHTIGLSPDQKKMALITTTDNELIFKEGWSRVEVLDLASGEVEVVTPLSWRQNHPSPYGWLEELAWSADSRALAFSIAYDGYATEAYVAEWDNGPARVWKIKRPGVASHEGALQWRGDARTLCFRGEDQARARAYAVHQVTAGTQGDTEVLTPGDLVVSAFDFDASGDRLCVVYGTTTHMNDLFIKNANGFERITNLNPQVDTWKLPQISILAWEGADGDRVEGILELPPGYKEGDGPLPLIVELHGGPTASTNFSLRLWIYGRSLMAAKGYALLSPNYHGSTGYGDEFTAKLIGRENEIEVTDIRTGIETLVAQGIADPDKMGVMGWSNGGFLTNAMITSEPGLFKAASSGAGVLDQVLQWGIEDTPGHVINYMEGLPWEKPEAYQHGSPLYKLGQVKTPTLIHVGGGDPRVPAAHSRALYRALRHYVKVPVELVVYPNEAHGLSTHENRLAKMEWDLAWFDRYILGKE